MAKITNYQLLKAKKMNNDYFKLIVQEVGLNYEHVNVHFIARNHFKINKKLNSNTDEIQNLFSLTKESDALALFIKEKSDSQHQMNFSYSGFKLILSFNANHLYESFKYKHLNEEVLSLKTNKEVEELLQKNNIDETVNVSLVIKKFGNYKNSTERNVHQETLSNFKTLSEVIFYSLSVLSELESKVPNHLDIVTSSALKGLNLPQDFIPSFMKINGFDSDNLKGSKRSIMWYASDEDGKGFDLNIQKGESYLISPYIRDYLSFDYYKKFNDESINEYYNFKEKSDVESLMSDLLYFIENDKESLEDEAVLFLKELLKKDEICNDYMLDCLFCIGDFDTHTQPKVIFYEVIMNNNFVMNSDEIESFQDDYVIAYTSMHELIIGSIDILNEVINSGDYQIIN